MAGKVEFLSKVARSPLRIIPRSAVLPILSGPLKGKKWIIGSSRHLCWVGSYERLMQNLVVSEVGRGDILFDVGANVGFYSLLAAGLVGSGKVFAFEPLSENVVYLRRHLHLNGINNVAVFELAIADQVGTAHFQDEESRAMGKLTPGGNRCVAVETVDSLLAQGKIAPPTFIKMDVEGAELKALLGARVCFDKHRPKLFLATHGEQIHEECYRLLRGWHYQLRSIAKEEDRAEMFAFPLPAVSARV